MGINGTPKKGRSCLPLRRKYEPILSFLSRVAQIPRHQEHALPFHAQPTVLDFIALKDDDGDCYEKQVHIGQIKVLIWAFENVSKLGN